MMRLNEIEDALSVDVMSIPNGSRTIIRGVIKRLIPSPAGLGIDALKVMTCTRLNSGACAGEPLSPRPSRIFVDDVKSGVGR